MGPLASLKGVHGTAKLGIPQGFCNPEGKPVWDQNERRSLRSSGKTEEATLDQPRRVISYVSQRGQRQFPQSWSHSCNQPKGVQLREGHQARPCPNCCSLSCFSPRRTRAAIPLPPLTTSHYHGGQHSAQDPNKWKTVLSPCHSLYCSFLLSLSLSPSLHLSDSHCLSPFIFLLYLHFCPCLLPPSICLPSQFTSALCLCIYSITFYFKPVPEPKMLGTRWEHTNLLVKPSLCSVLRRLREWRSHIQSLKMR